MLELLTTDEVDMHMKNKTFRIAFVGMSNAGKSYRSKVLRNDADFFWYHVDEEIQHALGFEDMSEISGWLGFPDSSTYQEKEEQYLDLENKYTKVNDLDTKGKNLVFDTTGSVIYLKDSTIQWLRENCLVVNLDVGDDAIEEMTVKFFENPKPLMWNNLFEQNADETTEKALRRCYPKLLKERMSAYRAISNINIPASDMRDLTSEETIEKIKSYLK